MSVWGDGRVLVVENSPTSGLRRFAEWWREDGLDLTIVAAHREPLPEPAALTDYDALVLLGGGLMPDADEKAPWLARERDLAVAALDSETPMLGICLGGQLLAHVAGGKVREKYGLPESGSTALTLRDAAGVDLLFHDLPAVIRAIEHHEDAITELPQTAVLLASSERCANQAFRLGHRAWGLQFHPEVSGERVAQWSRQSLIDQGFDPDVAIRQALDDEPTSAAIWREFAGRFATLARSGRPPESTCPTQPSRLDLGTALRNEERSDE